LVSSFVGCEQGTSIVEEYDWKFLQPMFLKCYHHLHLVENHHVEYIEHRSYEDRSLDIFEMIISAIKPMAKSVNRKLLIFRRFQVDPKEIKCFLQWWQKHESMFPIVGFLAQQILRIVGLQIEIEKIFFLADILTNLRGCCLRSENLEKLFFGSKLSLMMPKLVVNLLVIS
jgi:hypothetical protein